MTKGVMENSNFRGAREKISFRIDRTPGWDMRFTRGKSPSLRRTAREGDIEGEAGKPLCP